MITEDDYSLWGVYQEDVKLGLKHPGNYMYSAKFAGGVFVNNGETPSKGELLFSSFFLLQVKCTIFWLKIGLRVYLDLYAPDFPNSTSKYLFFPKVVRKHGSRCFTAICHFRMQRFFQRIILSCSIIQTFPNSYY